LIQELHVLGRQDLADAVRGGRKWHRLDDLLGGNPPDYEGAVGLRLAFNPTAAVPVSKEAWIKEAMVKYGRDEGLHYILESWTGAKKRTPEPIRHTCAGTAVRQGTKEHHHHHPPQAGPFGDIRGPGLMEKSLDAYRRL
jgi:hypothetical protein